VFASYLLLSLVLTSQQIKGENVPITNPGESSMKMEEDEDEDEDDDDEDDDEDMEEVS
jgi:transcription initiation factor TFIIF subunit beta